MLHDVSYRNRGRTGYSGETMDQNATAGLPYAVQEMERFAKVRHELLAVVVVDRYPHELSIRDEISFRACCGYVQNVGDAVFPEQLPVVCIGLGAQVEERQNPSWTDVRYGHTRLGQGGGERRTWPLLVFALLRITALELGETA